MTATTTNTDNAPIFSLVKSADSAIVGGWGDGGLVALSNGTYFEINIGNSVEDSYWTGMEWHIFMDSQWTIECYCVG
jgi:hypothetical protein